MSVVRIARAGLVAALIVCFGVGASPPPVGGLGVQVTPGKIEVAITPGTVVNVPVTVESTADFPVHIQTTTGNFSVADDGTYHYVHASSEGASLATWIVLRPREFDIAPHSFQEVQFTLVVPNRPLRGEYAGVVFIQTRPPRMHGAGVGVGVSARYADKVYATVAGTGVRDGRVETISAVPGQTDERYRVVFENTGTMHEYLNGRVEVMRSGSLVQSLPFRKNTLVERGGLRTLEVTGARLAPAAYDVVAVIDYGGGSRTGGKFHLEVHS
jgi:hypothetical protein